MSGSSERLPRERRIRSGIDYARVKAGAVAVRGRTCLLLVLEGVDAPSRVGFIASRRAVGGAVQRNRARRRLREIVRRRFADLAPRGYWLVLIAQRAVLEASHSELVADVERLLERSGAWRPR